MPQRTQLYSSRASHAVVGRSAVLETDAPTDGEAPGEERAKLGGAAVHGVRPDGLAEVAVRREGGHDSVSIADIEGGQVAGDHITGLRVPWLEDGGPEVAVPVDRPLAAVGAEHHRNVVVGFGDDCQRPHHFLAVVDQMRQHLYDGPPIG